jgi:uncharacterized repeat protein (TIGR01451 family)
MTRCTARPRTITQCLKPCFLLSVAMIVSGAFSATNIRAANNPTPFIDNVSPISINPGSTAVTLIVEGTGFVPASLIVWNGTSLSTTFVNSKKLTSPLPDSFVAAVGVGSVSVMSPAPGVGKSNAIFVPIAAAEVSTIFPSTPSSTVNVGTKPLGLVTADFNGDGISDIAVANNVSGTVSILLGNGDGTFTTKSTPSAETGANWLAVGDFNEDGIPDLAVANCGCTGLHGVSILLGNGDGTFTLKSSPNTGNGAFSLTTGDFNGDGHLDLAVANQIDGTVTILLGQGDGTFVSGATLMVGVNPKVIVAGDFNEDGILDLAVSNKGSNTVSVLHGIGDGTFQSQATFPTGGSGSPTGLIAADFNGDGHLDLAVVNMSDVGILLGDGNGSFALKANPGTGTSALTTGVPGDFNGDGKVDIVVSDSAAGEFFLLGGVGDGTFSPAVTYTTAAGAFGVTTGDFNGDGALDLAISNSTANNLSVFLQLLPVSLHPTSLSFGDQLVGTTSSPQTVTLTNNSGSTLNFASIGSVGTSSGDFSHNNTCGSSISNSGTCTINVTFTPSIEGPRSATLTVVDSASNSPQTVAVSGIGTAAPLITSANNTTFTLGTAGSFTVTASGFPIPSLSEAGSLPSGITFTDNGNGTATLAGTPASGTSGSYSLTLTALNSVGSDSQILTLTVASPPTITKVFGTATIALNASTSLTFTITNPNTTAGLTGVAFVDNLPSGLVVSTPNGLTGACGAGNITASAGSQSISLTTGTVATSSSCTFSVNVTATAVGNQVNTTGSVSATIGGTGKTATASLNVLAPDLTIAKSHTGNFFQGQNGATYSLTVSNVGAGPTAGAVTVTDTLPAGLSATEIGGTGWSCTIATISCVRNETLAASASFPVVTVTVNVAANAASSVTNTATVSGGCELNLANDTATDITTVTLPPDFTISVAPTTNKVRPGQQASYEITITPLYNVLATPVIFAASGLPARTSLVFNPLTLTLGANPAPSTLVVSTSNGDPYVPNQSRTNNMPLYGPLLPCAGLVFTWFGFRRRHWKNGWVLVFVILACGGLGICGCAGVAAGFQSLSTPIGTYTATITATSGSVQHSAPVTLVVQ